MQRKKKERDKKNKGGKGRNVSKREIGGRERNKNGLKLKIKKGIGRERFMYKRKGERNGKKAKEREEKEERRTHILVTFFNSFPSRTPIIQTDYITLCIFFPSPFTPITA